jgi:hypothetical protein
LCFYIYSPTAKLQIDYASEFIRLDKDGTSEVIVDLLVTNKSEDSVNHPKIIYPNRFYKIKKENKKVKRIGEWDDVTHTFLADHEYNWVYTLPGSLTSKNPSEPPPFSIPAWGTYFEIVQRDPREPLKSIVYQGIIGGGIGLNVDGETDYLKAEILRYYNYTIFKCSLEQPLEKDVPRWMRFKFKGECSIYNKEQYWLKRVIKKATNQLYYEYQIFGPYDVRDRLKTFLAIQKQSCEGECSPDLRRASIDLYSYLIKDGLMQKQDEIPTLKTKIVHWYLHVCPGKMERLTDTVPDGNIQIAGLMPNFIGINPEKRLKVYEWKSGFSNIESPEHKFSIFFQAKPTTLIYALISYIALILTISFNFDKIAKFFLGLFSKIFQLVIP